MSAIILLALRILLALILYAFLGLVIYTLLRDLRQQGSLLEARLAPALSLTNLGQDGSPSRLFSKLEVILGREADCDYPLDDLAVSSRHSRLSYHQRQWWVEDMASTNGTLLNGEPVTTATVITDGDELTLGNITLRIGVGN